MTDKDYTIVKESIYEIARICENTKGKEIKLVDRLEAMEDWAVIKELDKDTLVIELLGLLQDSLVYVTR